jgi:hypothetical protein
MSESPHLLAPRLSGRSLNRSISQSNSDAAPEYRNSAPILELTSPDMNDRQSQTFQHPTPSPIDSRLSMIEIPPFRMHPQRHDPPINSSPFDYKMNGSISQRESPVPITPRDSLPCSPDSHIGEVSSRHPLDRSPSVNYNSQLYQHPYDRPPSMQMSSPDSSRPSMRSQVSLEFAMEVANMPDLL